MRRLPILGALGHALRSTWNNLPFAWHVSWPWLAILVPISLAVEAYLPKINPDAADPQAMARNAEAALGFSLLGLASMLAFSSIAVSWHRYILKDDVPQGLARLRFDEVVWRYFGNTLLIVLLVVLAVLPFVLVISIFTAIIGLSNAVGETLVMAVAVLAAIPLTYRLMVKLPAIAVGNSAVNMKAAMEKTRGNSLQLCVAGVIVFLVVLLIGVVLGAVIAPLQAVLGSVGFLAASLAQQAVSWIVAIFSVTFLTSLYGFFVEKRDF